jgi:hypothetical protein
MIGLQCVRGLWRIYLDNQEDHELLLSSTLVLRNKSVNFYARNPRYAFKEKTDTTKVCVKDIPLSADDGQIIKALEDHNCDIIKFFRERLRINNYLTNCQTGDRISICNPIDTPLPRSLVIGKYRATSHGPKSSNVPNVLKMAIKQMSVWPIGDAVFVEFWDTNNRNVEKNHSLIMDTIRVVNLTWKMIIKMKITLMIKKTT